MNDIVGCPGFKAAGVAAGIKKEGALDLGLIYTDELAAVAGVFTRNRVQAAPVVLTKQRTALGKGRAVVVNAGNANCCTGDRGLADALAMGAAAAQSLNVDEAGILVASTGVIGEPLPVDKITSAMPGLAAGLTPQGFDDFSKAIMTTDTRPKLLRRRGQINDRAFHLLAVAKGAGMIRPDMATMLCFVCTDIGAPAGMLQEMLKLSVDQSLNRITIDGDTSTNDMVLLLANAKSGVSLNTPEQQRIFQQLLDELLLEMGRTLIGDGEGVTKVVELQVRGALSDADALRVADTVAHSPLVKTAFFGQDANWGRILAAAGRAGVAIEPDRIDIFFNEVQMVRSGQGLGPRAEERVTAILREPEFSVTLDLGQGDGSATMLTCDFSVDYVRINADYRS